MLGSKKKQTKPQAQWQNDTSNSSSNSKPTDNSNPRPFIESDLIRDLQFYDLNKRKAIQDLESLKLLGIRNGIRSVVKEKYPKLPVQDSDPPVDEGLIQNLLEDIRGSFERQFDDDLNALTHSSVMSGSFYPQESAWSQSQPPPFVPPHPPEWNPSNYLNVDFDHYFPPTAHHHPHPMSAYHPPQQSAFNYESQNNASTSHYSPYDSASYGSLQ
ncbi:unnamed protein product [Lepeophtheirus salmonis]|uniref:(salmon louse) hypothetical protein n=1 Tax=Lepeophtheirus salmonis TaxID=72036 RepID=A0A7R8CD72_LEPSM|nr:unnamed protein product [Lepeophtheirus salmonis]CAF2776551.1 unnamed protein product [Lepeophtheirus salmonis]